MLHDKLTCPVEVPGFSIGGPAHMGTAKKESQEYNMPSQVHRQAPFLVLVLERMHE